jgi:hypothetical protein
MSPADAALLLGVAPDASSAEIQHAFARQARLNHPDLLVDATEEERHSAGIRFARVRDARDVLLSRSPDVPDTPVETVHVVADGVPFRGVPMRNPWTTFLVFLLLAFIVVLVVTLEDGFRMEFISQLNGGVGNPPASP